jgi:hypothetical protein
MDYIVVDEINVIPFKYDNKGHSHGETDDEEKFKELYNKYQYVVDFLIKNKGEVLKTVDIPVIFDFFKLY